MGHGRGKTENIVIQKSQRTDELMINDPLNKKINHSKINHSIIVPGGKL